MEFNLFTELPVSEISHEPGLDPSHPLAQEQILVLLLCVENQRQIIETDIILTFAN